MSELLITRRDGRDYADVSLQQAYRDSGLTAVLAALALELRPLLPEDGQERLDAALGAFAVDYSAGVMVPVTDGAAECREALSALADAVDAYLSGDADQGDLRVTARRARKALGGSAILCSHANEVPAGACPCPAGCYCQREGTCEERER